MKKKTLQLAIAALGMGLFSLTTYGQDFHYIQNKRAIIIKSNSDGSDHQEPILLNVGIPGGGGGHITAVRAKHNEVVLEKHTKVNAQINMNRNAHVSSNYSMYLTHLRSNASNSEIIGHNKIYAERGLRLSGGSNSRLGVGISNPATSVHIKDGHLRVDSGQYQSWGHVVFRPDVDKSGDDVITFLNSDNVETARIHDGRLRLNTVNGVGSEIHSTGGLVLRPDIERNGGDDFVSFRNSNGDEKTRVQDGTITTDRVVLNVGSFPDYVFEEDYNLMPLNEVETYIKENKHLPNVPSEAEVIANGMSVGQINTILVEKVEELTLHTIDQENKIKTLSQHLEQQDTLIKELLKEVKSLKNR
ncbi:hypothetical protein [Aquimarina rhabdastrellae]